MVVTTEWHLWICNASTSVLETDARELFGFGLGEFTPRPVGFRLICCEASCGQAQCGEARTTTFRGFWNPI